MIITDGCVAGYSTYRQGKAPGAIQVEDGCRVGAPQGRLRSVQGEGRIIDFRRTNAKLQVRYPFLITFNYWVIYKAADASWFISTDPAMYNLWIYSRTVPSKKRLSQMVQKAKQLGYDIRKLEYPVH